MPKPIRLPLILIGAVTVALLTICIFINASLYSKSQQNTATYLNEIASQNINAIVKKVEGDIGLLDSMARLYAKNPAPDIDTLTAALHEVNQSNSFLRLGFASSNAMMYMVDSGGKEYREIDVSWREYVQRALAGEVCIATMVEDSLGAGLVNAYAVPVSQGDKVIGAMVAISPSSTLTDMVVNTLANKGGFSFILSTSGTLITRPSTIEANNNLPDNIFDFGGIRDDVKLSLKQSFADGTGGIFSYTLSNGKIYICGYAPAGISDWVVACAMPAATAEKLFSQAGTLCIISVLIMGIGCALSMLMLYKFHFKGHPSSKNAVFLDDLTGSYTRQKFVSVAQELLKSDADYTLAAIDIRKFKLINEIFGFNEGDRLLVHIAKVLRESIKADEAYFHDNGDKFIVMLKYSDRSFVIKRLYKIMEDIADFKFENGEGYSFACSCGLKDITPKDRTLAIDSIIDRVYLALEKSHKAAPNACVYYDEALLEKEKRDGIMENTMHRALENGEFKIFLQPKVSLTDGSMIGAEALVRWENAAYGIMSPMEFLPLFEKNGFITKLDYFVFESVCKLISGWLEKEMTLVPISVNHSRLLFYQADYVETIEGILKKYGVPSYLITLELTQGAALEDQELFSGTIDKLQALGLTVSMDDFGAGYSALNTLKKLCFHEIKLDKSFLEVSVNWERQKLIIKSIVALAKSLSIATVAEGVETVEQATYLKSIGCDAAQGYLFAKPMPIDMFEGYAIKRK